MKIYQYFSIDLPIRLHNFARHLINLHSTSQKIQDRQILLAFSLCDSGKALALQINKHKKEKLFSSALRHGFCLAKIKRHKNWTRTISHRRSCAHRTSTLDHSICRQINLRKRRKPFCGAFFHANRKVFVFCFVREIDPLRRTSFRDTLCIISNAWKESEQSREWRKVSCFRRLHHIASRSHLRLFWLMLRTCSATHARSMQSFSTRDEFVLVFGKRFQQIFSVFCHGSGWTRTFWSRFRARRSAVVWVSSPRTTCRCTARASTTN